MSTPTKSDPLEVFAANYLALRQLVADSSEAQWQAGKSPVPREDTTERSSGMTSDPTATITADSRRLKLRAAVLESDAALLNAEKAVRAARRHLSDALAAWQG